MIGRETLESTTAKWASSRAHPFAAFATIARNVLQHSCTAAGVSFFAGLEWNGHSLAVAAV
jgi:hypothetical protein